MNVAMDLVSAKTPPRGREQQQRQQVSSKSDKLKSEGSDIRADRAGPVVRFCLADRVPRRIVWIKRCGDQAKSQQQSDRRKEDREDLITTACTWNDDARLIFNLCSCGHENSQLKELLPQKSFRYKEAQAAQMIFVLCALCLLWLSLLSITMRPCARASRL